MSWSAGESLLWSGQPRKGIVFRGSDIFMIPFSIMWGGFAIFWETMVLFARPQSGRQVRFSSVLWGIPFVLVGLYMMFGRFLVDARRRDHTCYGVTDRRVIIVTGLFDRQMPPSFGTLITVAAGLGHYKVKSLDLRTMTDVSMTERSGGSGTITFGAQPSSHTWLVQDGPGWETSPLPASIWSRSQIGLRVIRGAQRKN